MKGETTVCQCERCGGPALALGEHRLCEACYAIGNSCCPEFGEYDRWQQVHEPAAPGSCGRLHQPR